VLDFMPRYLKPDGSFYAPPDVIRFIRVLKGTPKLVVDYEPRLNYAKEKTYTDDHVHYIKSYTRDGKYDSLYLYSNLDFDNILNKEEVTLTSNAFFLLGYHEKLKEQNLERAYLKFQLT